MASEGVEALALVRELRERVAKLEQPMSGAHLDCARMYEAENREKHAWRRRAIDLEKAAVKVLDLEGKATCAYPTADDAGAFYRALAELRSLIESSVPMEAIR